MRSNDMNSFFESSVPKPRHRSPHNDGCNDDFNAHVMLSNQHDEPPPFRLIGAATNHEASDLKEQLVQQPKMSIYDLRNKLESIVKGREVRKSRLKRSANNLNNL